MRKMARCFLHIGLFSLLLGAGNARLSAAPDKAAADPAAEMFYAANALYNRRLYPLAIKEYQTFLARHGNHARAAEARYGLALSYYNAGQYREAEPLLAKLAPSSPVGDRHQLALLRAHCLLNLNRVPEAEKAFAAVADNGKAAALRVPALAGLCETLFRQNKWEPCAARATALLALDPEEPTLIRALYHGACAHHQLRQFKKAIPLLKRLQERVEEGDLVHQGAYLLAECYRATDDLPAAARAYAEAAKGLEGEAAAEVHYRLGFVNFRSKEYDQAIRAFAQAIKIKPDGKYVAQARLLTGRAYLEKGDTHRARQTLQPLVNHSAEAALWLARVYTREKSFAEAEKILEPATRRFQRDERLPDLRYDLANARIVQNKFKEAAAVLAALAGRKDWPRRNDVLRMRAICLHRTQDYAGSLKVADEFIAAFKDDPLRPEVAFVRAENLYLLGRLDDALKAYRAFVAAVPAHDQVPAATFRIGQILHRHGQWEKALAQLEPLAKEPPESAVFDQLFFVIGDSRFRQEEWEPARTALTAFLKRCDHRYQAYRRNRHRPPKYEPPPNQDTARIELAVAAQNMDDVKDATAHFAALVKDHRQSPHRPLALAELGRLQYEAENYRSARQSLQQFLREYPKGERRPSAHYYLGWISLAENKQDEAAGHFGEVVGKHGRHELAPDACLQQGLVRLGQEKFPEAQKVFHHLVRTYRDHPRLDLAEFSYGVALARQEKWREAAPHFQRVADNFPDSEVADRALYEWAWCEKGQDRKKEAAARYRRLLEKYADSDLAIKARTELAELTFDAKEYEKVIAELTETLKTLKDPAVREQTLYRLGTAYFNQGDHEQSAATFDRFLKEFPRSELVASAHFQAGESRMKLKETVAARNHFAAASRTDRPAIRETALLRLGETRALTKQWRESGSAYAEFLRAYPKSRWIHRARFGLGWAYEKQNNFQAAVNEYRRVIGAGKKDELSARCQFQVGECLFAMKQYDAAVQELVKVQVAYGHKEWTAKALLEIGRALEAKGDAAAARDQFKEVMAAYPDHDVAVVARQRMDALRGKP